MIWNTDGVKLLITNLTNSGSGWEKCYLIPGQKVPVISDSEGSQPTFSQHLTLSLSEGM